MDPRELVALAERMTTHFDHFDPSLMHDPYPVYRAIRERCPVPTSENYGGFKTLLGYQDICDAATSPQRFVSRYGTTIPWLGNPLPVVPIESDPPEHMGYRSLIAPLFAKSRTAALEPTIRRMVREAVDRFIAAGSADLAADLAHPIPPVVLALFIGLPKEDWLDFKDWVERILSTSAAGDMEGLFAVVGELLAYFQSWFDSRRGKPGDDFATLALEGRLDGRALTPEEMLGYAFVLAVAGHETATSGIGNMLLQLGKHPEVRDRLLSDRALIPRAVEEFLRVDSPITGFARTVEDEPVEVSGVTLRPGEKVMLMWGAGNHDERQFPDPDQIKLDRPSNRHLAFGYGSHRCLGAPLARLQMRVVLEEVLNRLPDYEITGEVTRSVGMTHGVNSMPVRFTPSVVVRGTELPVESAGEPDVARSTA